MAAKNSLERFGWVSRTLHWTMAIAILWMLGLGTVLGQMQPGLSNLWLYGVHKSIGLTLLTVVLMRLLWHWHSPPPLPLNVGMPAWQLLLAQWVHRSLYIVMVLIPVSGWIGSSATGISTYYFGLGPLPRVAPVSEPWESFGFKAHGILTKILFALLFLHIAGALVRHIWHRDRTLIRMLKG